MEKLLLFVAFVFRSLPRIRGKHRMGIMLERLLLKENGFTQNTVRVKLKNGHLMLIDPRSDLHKGPLYSGEYDDKIIKLFSSLLQKDWVVFDVGASTGYWTLAFATKIVKLGAGGVVSFEPLTSNNRILRKNLDLNQLSGIVNVMDCALGDTEGKVVIHATEKGNTGNAYIGEIIEGVDHNFEEVVAIKKLDSFTDDVSRCDFIKMDIEGAEYFAIKGGLNFIGDFRPIIFGEFNSLFLDNFGFSVTDIDNMLRPLGYLSFIMNGSKFMEIMPRHKMQDILFVPKEKLGLVSHLLMIFASEK